MSDTSDYNNLPSIVEQYSWSSSSEPRQVPGTTCLCIYFYPASLDVSNLPVSDWESNLDMFWNCHVAFATMGLKNSITILALRTLVPSFLSTSNPSLSLTGWWLEAWLGLSMSPTSPCASALQTGSPCRRCPPGVWPVPGASWSLAGGPRGRSRHTSCRRSWGCRQGNVRAPPVGWTPAAAAEGGNRMEWCAPVGANWARIWYWCSGWC